MFENRVLRRIFGPKRDKGTREWRKLHNEDLNDLYSSPNIARVIKENEMGRACSVSGEGRDIYRVLVGKPEGRRPLGRQGVKGRIILSWIFRKWDVGVWNGSNWLRIGTSGRHL